MIKNLQIGLYANLGDMYASHFFSKGNQILCPNVIHYTQYQANFIIFFYIVQRFHELTITNPHTYTHTHKYTLARRCVYAETRLDLQQLLILDFSSCDALKCTCQNHEVNDQLLSTRGILLDL